jgi:uncharacterized protein (DUF2147 family)
MKKTSLLFSLLLVFVFSAITHPASNGDAILGTWETGSGKAHVEIKKYNNTYYGQVVWLKEPNDATGKPKTDKNNPDATRRQTPILGLRLLLGFIYKGENQWKDGTIYDPEGGSTYNCKIEMTDPDLLNIRGYIGISLLGRTEVWKRVKK